MKSPVSEKHDSGSYGDKFRIMLDMIAHPDGGAWTGKKMSDATNGQVTSSYFGALRDGHVNTPRADKIQAISQAMDFPTQLWFKDLEWWRELYDQWLHGDEVGIHVLDDEFQSERDSQKFDKLATLVDRLFMLRQNPVTGQPFTIPEVAERSGGSLTVDQIEAIRSGSLKDPSWGQILTLCEIFEIPATYFAGSEVSWFPSPALLDAAEDRDSYVTFTNSRKLSSRDRGLLNAISENFLKNSRATE